MTIDLHALKAKLIAEKKKLEGELGHLGKKDASGNWEATAADGTQTQGEGNSEREADGIDEANRIEDFEERFSVEGALEPRLNEVKMALAAMEAGTYGWCMEGAEKHEIEEGRLMANPAATTCIEHKK